MPYEGAAPTAVDEDTVDTTDMPENGEYGGARVHGQQISRGVKAGAAVGPAPIARGSPASNERRGDPALQETCNRAAVRNRGRVRRRGRRWAPSVSIRWGIVGLRAMTEHRTEIAIVAPGEGLAVENPVGGILTFKAMAGQCDGVVTALETVAAPGEGPPLHVHAEHELIYTLEGLFRIRLGDAIHEAQPGSFVFIPAGTPHTWQNISDRAARFFATIMPAATAFEEFFQRYDQLPVEQRGVEAFARLAAETKAFDVVGPTLAMSDPL